jgi:hypothetical protein
VSGFQYNSIPDWHIVDEPDDEIEIEEDDEDWEEDDEEEEE